MDPSIEEVEWFAANFSRDCESCGRTPVVQPMRGKMHVPFGTRGRYCGACYFGDERMADYRRWNS